MSSNLLISDNDEERKTLRKHLISEHGITPSLSESYDRIWALHQKDHVENLHSHNENSREFELDRILDYLANKY